MSDARVTREGLEGVRPGRDAPSTYTGRCRGRTGRRGETSMVPEAEFTSYYGKPVINSPVWSARDIAGYLFLGGLAGASSLVAAGAELTDQPELARAAKLAAAGGAGLSLVALVHDLGRPARFLNMLRVFKPSSPMSVGSWLLSAYGPAAAVAALSDVSGRLRPVGAAATAGAAMLGPGVASYTAVLISDTAVPAWHDGFREMPYVFVGSGATAAGGLAVATSPAGQHTLPIWTALGGVATELAASRLMERRLGPVADVYHEGRSGRLMSAGKRTATLGVTALVLGRRRPLLRRLGGAVLVGSSALTRFGIFEAGMASADDPRHTVVPQRRRLEEGAGSGRKTTP